MELALCSPALGLQLASCITEERLSLLRVLEGKTTKGVQPLRPAFPVGPSLGLPLTQALLTLHLAFGQPQDFCLSCSALSLLTLSQLLTWVSDWHPLI